MSEIHADMQKFIIRNTRTDALLEIIVNNLNVLYRKIQCSQKFQILACCFFLLFCFLYFLLHKTVLLEGFFFAFFNPYIQQKAKY